MPQFLDNADVEGLSELLEGHRIVNAELTRQGDSEGFLLLDDGTMLELFGNEGCGGCSSGWYDLTHVAKVDNIITRVRVVEDPDDEFGGGRGVYEIFVFTENEKVNVATFTGTDGNGYYGSGFSVRVRRQGE